MSNTIENMCRRLRAIGYTITPPEIKAKGKDIGSRVHLLRSAYGYSLQDLADKVGTSKSHIWEIEQSRTKNIGSMTLLNICDALETTPNHILMGEKSTPAETLK